MSTSSEPHLILETGSPEATYEHARSLGALLGGGEVLALTGPLGAGKTHFAKGVADGLGIDPRNVTSPTFLLAHELQGRLRLHHLDAYRAASPQEFSELGFDDFLPSRITTVRQDLTQLAQQTVNVFRRLLDGPHPEPIQIKVPCSLITRITS